MFRALAVALLLAPALVGVHPNPVTDGDRGEYVVVDVPRGASLSSYTLSDGETTVRLPNVSVSGRVAVSTDPAAVRNLTALPVIAIHADLRLANGGEDLVLARNGTTVSRLGYEDAPEGEVYENGTWTPLGATDFPPLLARNVPVRAFVLPDDPTPVVDALQGAQHRLLVAGYTFSSWRVARVLRAADRRGVNVRVLVEGGPVGGVTSRETRVLDSLTATGVRVRVLDGPRARFAFHHAKYAVADDRALVTSENWKPGGTGGHATRGWGVAVRNETLADHLAAVHTADSTWRDAVPWTKYRENASSRASTPANATYSTRFEPWTGEADARVLVTPDNAGSAVLALLNSADRRLLVEQVRIDDDTRFLNATLAAARRGVRVRVLLSSAWYVREDNRRLVDELEAVARTEGLDLRAHLVDPRSRFDHLHVKGVVADDRVLIGSLNWNHESVVENREVVVVLEGAVADYYARVFRADWRGGIWRLPLGLVAVVLGSILVAGVVLRRRVSFSASARTEAPRRVPRPPSSR